MNLLFTTHKVSIDPGDIHITDQYLRLVSAPFNRDFTHMKLKSDIYTLPEDDSAVKTLLATMNGGPVFLFHYGTTWQTKFWTETGWIELGKYIRARYPDSSILLSWGSEAEQLVVTHLAAGIGSGATVIERYSLKKLTALLKTVDLVVGGDTGPVHLAAAVGTATVSYYRASNGKRSGPRGDRHVIIQAPLNCTACFRTKCDKDAACRDTITVEAVAAGIEKLIPPSSLPSKDQREFR
jgi:heptosyltransferase-1